MQEQLNQFCSDIQNAFGENLVAVVLYGSAANGDFVSKKSNINVIVLLKEIDLRKLSGVQKIIDRAARKGNIHPVFWTEDEMKNSADVFPVEFMDIKERHKVLYGRDAVKEIFVDQKNLWHQLEFELRSKLLRLRGEWLAVKGSKGLMLDSLARAGTSLLHLFRVAQKASSGKFPEESAAPFKECIRIKKGEIRPGTEELERLYQEVHNALAKIIAVVDRN